MVLEVNAKVLVRNKHPGIVRYLSEDINGEKLVGIELDRPVGDCNGSKDGVRLFDCDHNKGIFVKSSSVREFSLGEDAACVIQNMWRRWLAIKTFRGLLNAATWNMLDNNQEQLNLKRAERVRSAEQALSLLVKQKEGLSKNITPDDIIGEDYNGARIVWPLTLQNVLEMLESFKTGKILHHKFVIEILNHSKKLFSSSPTLQEINLQDNQKITIVGDLHGQLQDLFSIFTINGIPSETNMYLFNGDFVDRGDWGTEVMMTLLTMKLLYPNAVFLNRGNHESRNQNSWMGFEDELWGKYDGSPSCDSSRASRIFNLFSVLFDSLPLCAVVHGKIFVAHGGLSGRDGVTLTHLKGISRKREPPLHQTGFEDQVFEDLLWSDPRNIRGRQPSERGAGVEFGTDVTNNFCAVNRIALIVRSHECVPEGYEVLHGGRLITLFSASRYCGTQTNKGAFLTLANDLQPEIQQFYAHPMNKSDFGIPDQLMQENLEGDNLRMIAERICDHKPSLFWYFTQHDHEKKGRVTRLVWADALRSVLQLDIPFLNFQKQLADAESDQTINYSKFLARYRIENTVVDNTGWQEGVISNICKKLYKAMGAGSMEQAFSVFDTDANGFIEYDEFMTTLKKLDTGLSEQQVYELMKTADANEDGRIDFKEFAQRFEVIFTDLHKQEIQNIDMMEVEGTLPPPAPMTGAGSPMNGPSKLLRRISDREKALNPTPAPDIDAETMSNLVQIGRVMFQRDDSLTEMFHQFDINNDGVLQENEFYMALEQLGFHFSELQRKRIMEAVDVDGGNTIEYKEFLDAFSVLDTAEPMEIEKGNMTWQQSVLQQMSNVFYQHRIHIRSAFRMFDQDHTGVITKDEFRAGISMFNSLLNSPLTSDQIEELLTHLDKNEDGVLCYSEFFDGFRVVDVRNQDTTPMEEG